jgi:hypothetical protein
MDVAFCEGLGATSAGAIIRDSTGKVVLSAWKMGQVVTEQK